MSPAESACAAPGCRAHRSIDSDPLRQAGGNLLEAREPEPARGTGSQPDHLLVHESGGQAWVDAGLCSAFTIGDATRPAEPLVLAVLTPLGQQVLEPRELTDQLFELGLVQTFWHIGSELCLVEEEASSDGWKGRFEGTHVYYTNERNEEGLDFWLGLRADGAILLSARGEELLSR